MADPISVEAGREAAWLVERTDSNKPLYWAQATPSLKHRARWTDDASKAVRFCREQDANEVVLLMNTIAPTSAIAREHMWPALSNTSDTVRVPREPTAEMLAAFEDAAGFGYDSDIRDGWLAMISASTIPDVGEGG